RQMSTLEETPSRAASPIAAPWRTGGLRLSELSSWRYRDTFLLGSLVFLITAINLLWVRLDSDSVSWDFARHLGDSLYYKDTFSLLHPIRYLEGYTYYPPFMYWVTDLFYAV